MASFDLHGTVIASAMSPALGRRQKLGRPFKRGRLRTRRGATTVEFAIIAPIFFFIVIMPSIEFSRAFIALELVANAARSGCRVGVLSGNDNNAITTAVNNNLSSQGISGATTTVKVNGATANASTAVSGDTVSVTVSIPYDSNSWLPLNSSVFLKGKTLSSTQVMRRE